MSGSGRSGTTTTPFVLLVGVEVPQKTRGGAYEAGLGRCAIAVVSVVATPRSVGEQPHPEEERQLRLWREWRSFRPNRGAEYWDAVDFGEVWILDVPVPLLHEDVIAPGGREHLLGGKFISERMWEKLANATATVSHGTGQQQLVQVLMTPPDGCGCFA